ncbi:MAG TPA: cytochrome c [Gammaproteobacteria bacterium]|nr:cytochrome c [Gammaproteobacteria bacterium]
MIKDRLIALIILCLFPAAGFSRDEDISPDGRRLYQANCAVCHGSAGKPDPENPAFKQLGILPANFTDPLFNSREPSKDWFMVIKHGGAALGRSDIMPAFRETLSDNEIRSVVAYIKTLAGDHGYPSGDMNFILPIRTKKAFPEDEVVWKFRYQDDIGDVNRDQIRNVLEIEKRFFRRLQLSVELSHSFDDAIDDNDGNFDQVEPGIKYVLYENPTYRFITSIGTFFAIKTEEHDDSDEFIPYIAAAKRLADTLTFQGTARSDLPFDKFSDGNVELSGVVHWSPSPWPRSLHPGLELVSSFPIDRGEGNSRKEFAQLSLIPQAQIGLTRGGHVALNVGAELPLNDTDRYDYRGYIYLIWDFADGGFFQGW